MGALPVLHEREEKAASNPNYCVILKWHLRYLFFA